MGFFSKLFGRSSPPQQDLIPLLDGVVGTLEGDAKPAITESLAGLDQTESGRCLMNYMFITIASVANSIKHHIPGPKGDDYSKAFEHLALSTTDRSPGITEAKQAQLYQYVIGEVSNGLKSGNPDSIEDVGLTVLSLSCLDREGFPPDMVDRCGNAAYACWQYAARRTANNLGVAVEAGSSGKSSFTENDVEKIDFGKYFYLMNYRTHYSDLAEGTFLEDLPDEHKCLSELFFLRSWTTQFGFRIFNSHQHLVDSILYQIVNQANVLGIEAFRMAHGFSPEEALGDDFMSLLESRWQEYDREVELVAGERRIPALEIASKTLEHCSVVDPIKTYNLSLDLLAQLNQIKQEAIQLRLLKAQ